MSGGSFVTPGTRDRVRGLAIPIATALGRLGLTPNALTLIGFIGTCVAAFAAASQAWLIAGVLVLVFGIFDLFDGTLARATGKASRLGAFLDSVFDRAGEAIVYVGVAVGCLSASFEAGAILASAAMGSAFMVSYTRARSEGLGFTPGSGMAAVGLAPREIRIVILAAGLVLAARFGGLLVNEDPNLLALVDPWGAGRWPLALALGLIAILATITSIQRIIHVVNQNREQEKS